MPKLTGLNVPGCGATDALLDALVAHKSLQVLDVKGTKVTTAGVKRLMLAVPGVKVTCNYDPLADPDRSLARWVLAKPRCDVALIGSVQIYTRAADLPDGPLLVKHVRLPEYKLTDADVERLAAADALTVVDSTGGEITAAGLELWARAPNAVRIEQLCLISDQLTDDGLAHLAGFKSLKRLSLAGKRITGAGLGHLTGLTQLETLDLCATGATREDVEGIRRALPNCKVFSDLDKP